MPLVVPAPLRPGDAVALVAPAGPLPRERLWPGLAWLRSRYRLVARAGVLEADGYLAGSDVRRRDELAWAMTEPGVRAVVAGRGGYGALRILDGLPWDRFARDPRWLVGFSDVTAVHVAAAAHGVASLHAANVTGLGPGDPVARLAWTVALERPDAPFAWKGLELQHGRTSSGREAPVVRGPLFGGNLSLLQALAAAGRLVVPEGAILVLEDVTEAPYRVDRMLTSLQMGGHLDRAGAIVFGTFEGCEPLRDGRTVLEVLRSCTAGLVAPVWTGAPVGHGKDNLPFRMGRQATVEGGTLTA